MLEDRVDRDLVAVDDVEDAVRDTGLLQQLSRVDRRRRVLLGRLEDERVAAGERRRPHPHRDHGREVERRDPRADADRLPDRIDVDPGRGLLGEAALQQLWDPAAELDHLEPARDLALRVREYLAVLGREDLGDVLTVRVDECADAEEDLSLARERDGTPGGKGLLRSLDGAIDLFRGGEIDLARLDARRRVVDRAATARLAGHRRPVDPMGDPL
ncbi:MAG: hypothetical protein AUG88_06265 [Actinobacteria bacterium 13_1_20CM_4_68_12]|nr:MAG: hypothetical protein AUG88_06265 [Actinobacteria bacterium 13_1_20CM_4_68_12]